MVGVEPLAICGLQFGLLRRKAGAGRVVDQLEMETGRRLAVAMMIEDFQGRDTEGNISEGSVPKRGPHTCLSSKTRLPRCLFVFSAV
jgi:hypothetical protein